MECPEYWHWGISSTGVGQDTKNTPPNLEMSSIIHTILSAKIVSFTKRIIPTSHPSAGAMFLGIITSHAKLIQSTKQHKQPDQQKKTHTHTHKKIFKMIKFGKQIRHFKFYYKNSHINLETFIWYSYNNLSKSQRAGSQMLQKKKVTRIKPPR